ncbi:MAG: hypothetical protein ACREKN_05045 [Longimicrobiaceae bacterium]
MTIRHLALIFLLATPFATGCADSGTSPETDASVFALLSDPLELAPGEVALFEGALLRTLQLSGGSDGAEYLYVPFNSNDAGAVTIAVDITGTGVQAPTGPPNPALAPGGRWLQPAVAASVRQDASFHRWLRETELLELEPLIGPAPRALRNRAPLQDRTVAAAPPQEGELIELNASLDACDNPDIRTARVMAVTEHAIVVEDTTAPGNGLTQEEYRSIGVTFDTLSYPVNIENFGVPTDIDDNDRAIIFYTPAVNSLTPPNSGSFVAGFFFARDLFPADDSDPRLGACPTSNEAEMFYMLVADPDAEFGNAFTRDFILRITQGTIAHEFQHLINSSRRLYVNDAGDFEEVWLNEGLSHIAEELVFYRASGLGPNQNIDLATLTTTGDAVLNAVNSYQVQNLVRYSTYLEEPEEESLLGKDAGDSELPTRGATWAFLRYLADHRADDDSQFFFELVNSTTSGVANLERVLGEDAIDLMQTWTVSVYTDDAVGGLESPLYRQPSWHFRDVLPALNEPEEFPLEVLTPGPDQALELSLHGGGAAFIRFGVAPDGRALLRARSGEGAPPEKLRVSIIRIR